MASVLPQQPQSMPGGGATDRLLESFTLAEQGGHAFLAEDGPAGSIVYTTVFLQDEEGDEVEIEDHQMLQRLQAALNNASSSATLSGATTATASSSASSDSGAAADGDEKDAWKAAVMEGIEDLLQLGGNVHDTSHSSGHHSRRFSFDLTNIDMAALEQLACVGAASSPGPSSRRGSISLSFLEAEGVVVPKLLTTSTATASSSSAVTSSTSAAAPAAAATAGLVAVKPELAAEEKETDTSRCRTPSTDVIATENPASSSSSASTSGSSSCSGSSTSSGSTKRKAPSSSTATTGGAAANKASVKRKLSAAAAKTEAKNEQKEEAPGSPALASTAAAMMLPCTPEHNIVDKASPTAAKGASAATTAAMAALAASAATSSASSPNQGGGPSYALPALPDDGLKRVGIYTVEERRARVARFQAKRSQRVWKKAVKYACRKNLADNRPRVKGRFVKREEEIDILVGSAMAASSAAQGSLLDQLIGLDDLLAE